MELLLSNYPPVKTSGKTFSEAFYGLLNKATSLDIAVGYISVDSLIELQKTIELNHNIRHLNLVIGMHYYEGFSKVQYRAANTLNTFLNANSLGEVKLVTAFRYHGKMYSYSCAEGPFAGIVGSNNLSSIVDGGTRVYESSMLFEDEPSARRIKAFIDDLSKKASTPLSKVEIETFNEENNVLEGQEFASKVSSGELADTLLKRTSVSFEIPVKTTPSSNLNVFFGKGRVSPNGLVKPRHWYEVELIVPKRITSQDGYPQSGTDSSVFKVITDDGWSFGCKVSGDYSKNLRSEGDLKLLGRWLKGRLENADALKVGDPVTEETLERYGRNTFTLTQTTDPNLWYIDFGVRK